jgi:pimeloyl-ACP methyl ester carboxylesterase
MFASSNPLTPGRHSLSVDELELVYHVAGSGPVAVVHPGGPGFAWEYLRMPTLEKEFTTVYIEPMGTGQSGRLAEHPSGYSRDVYERGVDAVITQLDAGRVHLIGHSHGGFVAQRYAAGHANRLASLVLYESAPAVGAEHFMEANRNLEQWAERNAGKPGVEDVLNAWRSVPTISDDDAFSSAARQLFPAYVADYWSNESDYAPIREAVSGTYISGLDASGDPISIDDRDVLSSIEVPTLVIAGEHDFICGPRWAKELHAEIPRSSMVLLQHSGHFGHFEEPDAFARAIVDFVNMIA